MDIPNIDVSNLLDIIRCDSMLFDLIRWHGNCCRIKLKEVCHFANAIELGRIRSKPTILFDLTQSTLIRFSLGIIRHSNLVGVPKEFHMH